MPVRVENINNHIIEWAIARAGFELQDFLQKFPKVEQWLEGSKYPTVKQLENFSERVHVPFGYMFLETPPHEDISFPFFRTGQNETDRVSLNVFHTIQMLEDRQEWLVEYLKEIDADPLGFVGKYTHKSDYKEVGRDIRATLSLSLDWASKHPNWERALDHLALQIEEAGIIITFNGVVGNNTSRKIKVEECRGFVLVDEFAPFIFVNARDAKAAQMFTIVHELAHIWIGKSAGFDMKELIPADHAIEHFCNKVAAEFLVPEEYLRRKWTETKDFAKLSKIFKVSSIVIARRALDLQLISKSHFFTFYHQRMAFFQSKKENQGSGGNFYATAKKRVGLRFAGYVNQAVKENKLLYRDAYRLTNLKGNTYREFVKEHLFQS
jgi:Zn-dependent peptidase ImmA (M78 family)